MRWIILIVVGCSSAPRATPRNAVPPPDPLVLEVERSCARIDPRTGDSKLHVTIEPRAACERVRAWAPGTIDPADTLADRPTRLRA